MVKKKKELRTELKQEEFIQSFLENTGNISECCRQIRINRNTFELWKKDEEFMSRLSEKKETMDDKIEQKIYEIAERGDKDLLKFYASRKMKHRGWIEKQEVEHSGETKQKIQINIPKEVEELLNESSRSDS